MGDIRLSDMSIPFPSGPNVNMPVDETMARDSGHFLCPDAAI
jgi:hypothetical protein